MTREKTPTIIEDGGCLTNGTKHSCHAETFSFWKIAWMDSPPPTRGAIANKPLKTVMRTSFRAALHGRLASRRYATGVRRMPTALKTSSPTYRRLVPTAGFRLVSSDTSRSPADSARNLRDTGE